MKRKAVIFIFLSALILVWGVWFASHRDVSVAPNQFPKPASDDLSAQIRDDPQIHVILDGIKQHAGWFSQDFQGEKQLFKLLRESLRSGRPIKQVPLLKSDLTPDYAWVAVTLFEAGQKPIRWITRRSNPEALFNRIVEKLRTHSSFDNFHIDDPARCRILLEVINGEQSVQLVDLQMSRFGQNRFEPGITGLKIVHEGQLQFYMPTDAAVKSHLTLNHVLNDVGKKVGLAKKTNRISKRIKMLLDLPLKAYLTTSVAFVSIGEDVLPLYRGYPASVQYDPCQIKMMLLQTGGWLLENLRPDGRFLYYYDAVTDSVIDHQHPNRTLENNYYNILRHCGGTITLLRLHERTSRAEYLDAARKTLEYLAAQLRPQDWQGHKACYVFYNKKAKLGGSGIALAAIMRYYQLTQDGRYNEYAHGLANHLLSRITSDGEMLGYYIHPSYHNGQPILNPTEQEKKELFSFYYPGEALMGLALYFKHMPLDESRRRQVRALSRKAMDFLIHDRPVKYADLFEPLPSDGWLMQAIEEWADVEAFCMSDDIDFVINDAKQMISHMYNDENSLYFDCPGTFFYNYGDHGYIDGARAEGLIAAYYLAKKTGNGKLAELILDNCKTVAESLMYSYNSEESAYMHKYPQKSIGTFRFKFTRQWVRVDTAQHAACFYVRLLFALNRSTESPDKNQLPFISNRKPDLAKKYTLFAAGDTMLARWMHYHVYEKGAAWPLKNVRELISNADISMVNLECVISTKGRFFDKTEETRPYLYRGRPEMLNVLAGVGIDLVVTANNHSMDYGPEALIEQIDLLESVGISQVGSGRNIKEARRPTYIKVDDIVVAFIGLENNFPSIAATSTRPGICHAMGEKAILEYLRSVVPEAKQCANLVVFTPHWGKNWTENPTSEHITLAHKIIDLGVDAILGHSSHHIHGIEMYKDKPIIYDMGSLVFDSVGQKRMRFSAGFLLEFDHEGFTKLSIYPLMLRPSQTSLAEGEQIQMVHNIITKLTSELDPDIHFEKVDGILTIRMNPDKSNQLKSKRPTRLYDTNRTTFLSSQIQQRKTNVVLQQTPTWTKGFIPVRLEHGVTVLGASVPTAVRSRGAFAMEVAFSVSGPIQGQWVAYLKGVGCGDSRSSFVWKHPIADGGWLANLWLEDQIVLDRTLVRMPVISEGKYELYWGLKNHETMSWMQLLEASDLDEGYVHVGSITVTNKNAPIDLSDLPHKESL